MGRQAFPKAATSHANVIVDKAGTAPNFTLELIHDIGHIFCLGYVRAISNKQIVRFKFAIVDHEIYSTVRIHWCDVMLNHVTQNCFIYNIIWVVLSAVKYVYTVTTISVFTIIAVGTTNGVGVLIGR